MFLLCCTSSPPPLSPQSPNMSAVYFVPHIKKYVHTSKSWCSIYIGDIYIATVDIDVLFRRCVLSAFSSWVPCLRNATYRCAIYLHVRRTLGDIGICCIVTVGRLGALCPSDCYTVLRVFVLMGFHRFLAYVNLCFDMKLTFLQQLH